MPEVDAFGAFQTTTPGSESATSAEPQGQPAAAPAPAPDDPTYEVTVAGQKQQVPLSELLKGYSRTSDYTRKTQLLAQSQKEWEAREAQYQQVLGEAQRILTDRALLAQHLQSLGASPQQAQQMAAEAAPAGDEVLTYAQAQRLIEEREKQLRDELKHQQLSGFQDLQVQQLTGEYRASLNQKLDEIATRHPDLPKIPGMDLTIKKAVEMQNPKSLDQALQMMDEAANYFASQIGELIKAKTAPGSAPAVHGIEPPRGSAVMPPAKDEVYDSLTNPHLHEQVLQDLQRLLK